MVVPRPHQLSANLNSLKNYVYVTYTWVGVFVVLLGVESVLLVYPQVPTGAICCYRPANLRWGN